MKNIWKIFAVIAIFFFCIILILAYNWAKESHKEESKASIEIFPSSFSIYEGDTINLSIHFSAERVSVVPVEWKVMASGDTGEIFSPAETDSFGNLTAVYHAPHDIDTINQSVTIIATVTWNGKEFSAIINGTIHPILHETVISISSTKKKMIAGETIHMKAKIIGFVNGRWVPLVNETIKWTFFGKEEGESGYKKLGEKREKTDKLGISETPFFLSDVSSNTTVIATAQFEMNLSGEIDYMGCSDSFHITVIPEKPGDFPIVLIHGWSGSVTNWLLNFTWWNITQKLLEHGYKVLDFDISKPGIQYLEYEPSWQEHHIPWIAGKVSRKIREALVLNGYPPNQTIDIIGHSMGGLIARFMAEHGGADVDFWNESWEPGDRGYPWYGDGDVDVYITGEQIDDIFLIGTPCHGVPPGINESIISVIGYLYFPWWVGQVPDMIYHSKFLEAMGYKGCDIVDYYSVGGDIGFILGEPVDFDGDGIPHTSDGLCPTESPYLEGKPLLIITGEAWPKGDADHMSLMAINDRVHEYILEHLV